MAKKITIKIKGHNVTCKHNNITDAELVNLIGKHCAYLQKSPARRKVYSRTKLALGFRAFGKRLGYVLKAIKTACSPGFNEPNRRQDTSRGLIKLHERAR